MVREEIFLPAFRKKLFSVLWFLRAFKKKDSLAVTGRASNESGEKCFNLIFEDIRKKINFEESDVVLDIGCSNGRLFTKILSYVGKGILVDSSKKQLDLARKNIVNDKATFIKADACEIDLKEAGVNKVICYSVVHYFKSYHDFERMLRNIYTTLPVGGKALIGDIPFYNLQKGTQTTLLIRLMGGIYVKYLEEKVQDTAVKIGFHAEIVAQDPDLPFYRTRKDLILEKR